MEKTHNVVINNYQLKLTEDQFDLFRFLFSEDLLKSDLQVEVFDDKDFISVKEVIDAMNGGV